MTKLSPSITITRKEYAIVLGGPAVAPEHADERTNVQRSYIFNTVAQLRFELAQERTARDAAQRRNQELSDRLHAINVMSTQR